MFADLGWITWGIAVAIFGLLVMVEVVVIRHIPPRKRRDRKDWSLALAAAYGLIFSFLLLWLNPQGSQGLGDAGVITYWTTRMGLPPLLFVIVAAIRNARRRRKASGEAV
jgi:hypothetical protein